MIEREYWNKRYREGGDSGWCSVGELQKWRWGIIDKHIDVSEKSVLDVGCGDLRFWGDREPAAYFGVDISKIIIEKNTALKPEWSFFCEDVIRPLEFHCDVVLCLEMLFHVMTGERYIKILENLNNWTYEYLFISCWSERPDPFVHNHYQAHYQLEEYLEHLPDLELVKTYKTKLGLRAMYVFRRK